MHDVADVREGRRACKRLEHQLFTFSLKAASKVIQYPYKVKEERNEEWIASRREGGLKA